MLKELNYIVNGQTLTGESFKMASDTVNEIKVSFAFEGTDWDGLDSIKAVFSNNRVANSYEAVLVNGTCTIPHEVLTEKGTVSVNLYGSIVSGTTLTTRITSYKSAVVDVLQKVNVSGSNSVVPTPATWQQELSAHTQNTTVHVTEAEKSTWNAKLDDAESDDKVYGRKNEEWVEVVHPTVEVEWGDISGTLADQEDLAEALDGKAPSSHNHNELYYGKSDTYTKAEVNSAISNHHDSSKADASNVYTKTESDSRFALASAILDMATKTWVNAQGFITSLAGYATEAWVNAKNYATESWVEAKGYLTEHQSLSAYRTSSAQDTIDAGKVDKVEGKGLSTNDYDDTEKGKVASALQPSALSPYRTSAAQDAIDAGKQNTIDLSIVNGQLCVTYEEE